MQGATACLSLYKEKFQAGQVRRLKASVTTVLLSGSIFLFSGEGSCGLDRGVAFKSRCV